MTEEQKEKASAILIKPPRTWSKEDSSFLYSLMKLDASNRNELKRLRAEALLA